MRQASLVMGVLGICRIGLISSYDPTTYTAKVNLQPTNIETGWLPIKPLGVGPGWGSAWGPSQGDQVLVIFQEGSLDGGIVIGGIWSDIDQPLNPPSGEWWTVHKSGSSLKFTNDGKVALVSNSDLNVTVGGNVNATITGKLTASASEFDLTGNLVVTGNISASGTMTATGDVKAGSISLQNHKHGGVQTGGGVSGGPQ